MLNRKILSRFYPVVLILIVFVVWKCRKAENDALKMVELTGLTMGTSTYSIKYYSDSGEDFGKEIDSLLTSINNSFSTYIPESEISTFNSASDCFTFSSPYFLPLLQAANEVYLLSNGAFDPTVGPIVNAWGFGPDKPSSPDSATVQSLLNLVGFNKIHIEEDHVCKELPEMKIDFSAIAQGYAVDKVKEFLIAKGKDSFLVEISGEIYCKGLKTDGESWRTAVEDPSVKPYERRFLAVIPLQDRALATSGNYRNYFVDENGKKYVHTINPRSGYPSMHELLSATVFAGNCTKADALATAFMVVGVEKAKEILAKDSTLDAFLIYSGENGELKTYASPGIESAIEILPTEDQEENNVQISN